MLISGIDSSNGIVDNRQSPQSEKVKLYQANGFHIIFVKLTENSFGMIVLINRTKVTEFTGSNHHSTGMFSGVSGQAFQLQCHIQQFTGIFVSFLEQTQLTGFFQSFGQCDSQIIRNQLGNSIDHRIGITQNPTSVTNYGFGTHGSKSNNLANLIRTIGFGDIFNHFIPSVHAKIHIKVRHGNPFWVQKPFEQQFVFQRI